jgi:glycosyltransferase involved in cell wall biosynthesis
VKGKITQALAAGVPVVTTTVGAEGLHAEDGVQLLVADSDVEIADRLVRILTEPELWRVVSAAGQKLARERFSPEVMARVLGEIMTSLPELRADLAASHGHEV